MAEVTELKPPKPGNSGDTPVENGTDQPTPATAPQKSKGGRPPNGARRPPEARQPAFFDKVASVPREDWGTRAFMYVYVDEPACNPKTFGESRYLLKSSAPILDLEGLKQDYGSFKGWMSLNLRKTGKDATDEVDRLNFEIYDPKHPPKIPRGSWANDARNKRWLDLLPPEPPPANAAAASLIEGAKFYKDVRNEVKDEMAPQDQRRSSTSEVLETMLAAKELFGTPTGTTSAAIPPADPFDTAAKIMAMRANDPMMAVMMELLKNANTANEASRQREYELLKAQTNAAPAKTIVDQLLEIATNAEKLKPLKEIFGFGAEAVVTRASRTTGMDILNNLVSGPAGAALAQGIGQLLMAAPSMLAGNPANGQPMPPPPILQPQVQTGPPPPENPEQRINRIGAMWTRPLISEFFMKNAPGDVFAESMWDVAPDDYVFLKSFGAENLVDRYRRFPQAWTAISYRPPTSPGVTSEQEFIKFMEAFCAWEPPKDEVEQTQAATDGVEDLDDKEEVEVS
jgi:hypothetical protein